MARVGIVIYSLAGGGAERVSVTLAEGFSERGHGVDFVLGQRHGELLSAIPATAGVYAAQSPSAAAWSGAIRNYVQHCQPNVLLAMMEGAGVLALKAARTAPVYVVSHVNYSRHRRRSVRWSDRHLMPLAVRWYLRRSAGVVGVSHGVTRDIRQSAGLRMDQVRTVYNPVITDKFGRLVAAPVDHPWLADDRSWLTVVTVGRLTEQKDHATLLRAIRTATEMREVRLLVLGQGEAHDGLVTLAQSLGIGGYVDFLGFLPNPYPYMASADVFALSSAWEGFGNVLVEALAAGTTVVSTDCESGPREILADGAFGALVPVGDHRDLAQAILDAPAREIDRVALKQHLQQFEAAHVVNQYLGLLGIDE